MDKIILLFICGPLLLFAISLFIWVIADQYRAGVWGHPIKKNKRQSYPRCYTNMKYVGHAAKGRCCGLLGGDITTGYLQRKCFECPYLLEEDDG